MSELKGIKPARCVLGKLMSTRTAEAPLVSFRRRNGGALIIVAADQLDPVVRTLRDQNVPLQVDDEAVMLDGRPALMVIDLGHGADVERIQAILDRLSAERQRSRASLPSRLLNRS